jgi:hypothetical protein
MMEGMAQKRASLAARLRMARRVAETLLPQDEDVLIEAAASGETLSGDAGRSRLRTDFLVTVLDLRIRLSLLPEESRKSLESQATLESAAHLLWEHPETLACLLVADDEELSSRIVEFGDASRGGDENATIGPARQVLADYLATLRPEWPTPTPIASESPLSLEGIVMDASRHSINERRQMRARVPERTEARETLGSREVGLISELTLMALRGSSKEFDSAYTSLLEAER